MFESKMSKKAHTNVTDLGNRARLAQILCMLIKLKGHGRKIIVYLKKNERKKKAYRREKLR